MSFEAQKYIDMHYLSFTFILLMMTISISAQDNLKRKMTAERKAELASALQQLHERQLFNGTLLLAEKGKIVFENTGPTMQF